MMRTHSMRAVLLVTALLVAVSALAQTEYESLRGPALQRLGAHLQTDAITDAREELAAYCTQYPGDAVMQYNLACLDALVGRTDAALAHLDDALAAGYRDLGRILHDPDLAVFAEDPRLTARLDAERSALTARMMAGAFDLEEGAWSEQMPLLPDPFGPGLEAAPDTVRVRYDRDGVEIEVAAPAGGVDELILCVTLPRNLDEHETDRWFEFRASHGRVERIGRHGRVDPAPEAGLLEVSASIWNVRLPWSALHPYQPPVELLLGLNVTTRRLSGAGPSDRRQLVADPHAASGIQPWRRFVPVYLDPGLDPVPAMVGRFDTYLVVGDTLSVELGLQGVAAGPASLVLSVAGAAGDLAPVDTVNVDLEPDLAFTTVRYDLTDVPVGWFRAGVDLCAGGFQDLAWRDRGFRLAPDWFITQQERLALVPAVEQPIVQYPLFRVLRGQQGFQPHDDPTAIADAVLAAIEYLDRAEANGSVLPAQRVVVAAAFPVGADALQACRLVLPDANRRRNAPAMIVLTDNRNHEAALANVLAARPARPGPGVLMLLTVETVPGQPDSGQPAVTAAGDWLRDLFAPTATDLIGLGNAAALAEHVGRVAPERWREVTAAPDAAEPAAAATLLLGDR